MYGERTDALNAGVPTDRLIAEWDVARESDTGSRPDAATVLPRLIDTTAGQGGNPTWTHCRFPLASAR